MLYTLHFLKGHSPKAQSEFGLETQKPNSETLVESSWTETPQWNLEEACLDDEAQPVGHCPISKMNTVQILHRLLAK